MKAGIPLSWDRRSAAMAAARGLPPLLVAAQRVAATVAAGIHGRRRTGTGDSFWQFRPYRFGDSMARIDWRQSAKSDALFLRDREWEAAQSLWLWRDASASMDYCSAPNLPTKRARSEILALALASLLLRAEERVALLGRKENPEARQTTLLHLAQRLFDESGGDGLPPTGPVLRYGRVLLFSDFLTETEALADRLRLLADAGVFGHLVQILDPAELSLPFAGLVRFLDSESREEILAPRVEDIRPAYRARLAAHTATLRDLTQRMGWRFVRHVTNQAPSLTLMTLYQQLSDGTPRGRRIG